MSLDIQHIFSYPPIHGITINTVALAPEVRTFLYLIIGLTVVIVSLFLLLNGRRFVDAIRKSIFTAFFVSGIIYAIHADIGWSSWLDQDTRTFYGIDGDLKLVRLEGSMADFAIKARSVLGPEYTLFTPDSYLLLRTEYFLLPLRRRELAQDIVVLGDNTARYDPATRTFTRDTLKIENVDPLLIYARNAYILRIKK